MSYFVTGATGFIGRNLVELLLEREGTIYVLVREGSRGRLEELRSSWGDTDDRIVPIVGDLSQPTPRGVRRGSRDPQGRRRPSLPPGGDLRHEGRRRVAAGRQHRRHPAHGRARRGGRGGCVHMVSSIASAGLYPGTWREDMFEEARRPRHRPVLPHQARLRGHRPRRADAPVAGLPPRDRRRQLGDRRDGQGRRAVLLLQADPPDPQRGPAVAADGRGSRGGRSTSSRSTSSSRRWTTSRTRRASTTRRSASPIRTRSPPAR